MPPKPSTKPKSSAKKSITGKTARRPRVHNLTVEERKKALASDPDVLWFNERMVFCRGCECTISLDKRNCYYRGFWEKHKLTKTCRLNRARHMNALNREDQEIVNAAKILVSLRN